MRQLLPILSLLLLGCDPPLSTVTPNEVPASHPTPSTTPKPPERLAPAGGYEAKVIGVTDGDTIKVLTDDNQQVTVRLHGIDCPERGQPYGNNATNAVKSLMGKRVTVVDQGSGGFGRRAADVYLVGGTVSINMQLVQMGWAWWSPKYSDDERLGLAEANARESKRGLWAAEDGRTPVNPADWRKLSKVERDKLR